jgi:CheY-like chemotaxis protein
VTIEAEPSKRFRAKARRVVAVVQTCGPTIVIVDDASIVRSLGRPLTAHGCQVRTFAAASEALARDLPRSNVSTIVDVNMPQIDGYQFCGSLRNSGHDLPMIASETELEAHGTRVQMPRNFSSSQLEKRDCLTRSAGCLPVPPSHFHLRSQCTPPTDCFATQRPHAYAFSPADSLLAEEPTAL